MPERRLPKRHIDDLAAFGGETLFAHARHVGRPNIGDRAALYARLDRALDDRWLSNRGPLVIEFEERIAALTGVAHAIAVTNGTGAIELTARALELSGEVIVPSFTFVGSVHALSWMGLTPVFVDIGTERPVLDPVAVERLIGPSTAAILGVHMWGHVCDVDALEAIAARHGLPVIYDAAHALMNSRDGAPVGSFGRAEILSFHATKFVNAFEGGAITTDDDDLAERLRRMRNFGFKGRDRVAMLGTNAKMHEASAAMGLTSLDAAGETMETNRANAAAYGEFLDGLDGLTTLAPDPGVSNAQYVAYRVDRGSTGISRDSLLAILQAENVLARRYFYPGCHRLDPYRDRPELIRSPLPDTERLADEVLVLPTGTGVSRADIEAIADFIGFTIGHAGALAERELPRDPRPLT